MRTSEIQSKIEALYITYMRNKPIEKSEQLENFFQWLKKYDFDTNILHIDIANSEYEKKIGLVCDKIYSETTLRNSITGIMFILLSTCYETITPFQRLSENVIAYFISKNSDEIEQCFFKNIERINSKIATIYEVNIDDIKKNFQKILEFFREYGKVAIFIGVKNGEFKKAIHEAEESIQSIKKDLRKISYESKSDYNKNKSKKKAITILAVIVIIIALISLIIYALNQK